MEVKSNLVKDERAALLNRFPSDTFKKIAHVQLGEPDKAFKAKTHEVTLAQKQKASDVEFRKKQAEEKRKKAAEKKAKEVEKARAKAEKEKAKKAAALEKAKEKARKAAEKVAERKKA